MRTLRRRQYIACLQLVRKHKAKLSEAQFFRIFNQVILRSVKIRIKKAKSSSSPPALICSHPSAKTKITWHKKSWQRCKKRC